VDRIDGRTKAKAESDPEVRSDGCRARLIRPSAFGLPPIDGVGDAVSGRSLPKDRPHGLTCGSGGDVFCEPKGCHLASSASFPRHSVD
jgi:hypothetical protein